MPLINDYAFGGGGGIEINGVLENYKVAAGQTIGDGDFVEFEDCSEIAAWSSIHSPSLYDSAQGIYVTDLRINCTAVLRIASIDANRVLLSRGGVVDVGNILTYTQTGPNNFEWEQNTTMSRAYTTVTNKGGWTSRIVNAGERKVLYSVMAVEDSSSASNFLALLTLASSTSSDITVSKISLPASLSTPIAYEGDKLQALIKTNDEEFLLVCPDVSGNTLATIINISDDDTVSFRESLVIDTSSYNVIEATRLSSEKILVLCRSGSSSKLILLKNNGGSLSIESTSDISSRLPSITYNKSGHHRNHFTAFVNCTKYLNKAVVTYVYAANDIRCFSVDCTNGISLGSPVSLGILSYDYGKLQCVNLEENNIYLSTYATLPLDSGGYRPYARQEYLLDFDDTLAPTVTPIDWHGGQQPPGTLNADYAADYDDGNFLIDIFHTGNNGLFYYYGVEYSYPVQIVSTGETYNYYCNVARAKFYQLEYTPYPKAILADSSGSILGVADNGLDGYDNSVNVWMPAATFKRYGTSSVYVPAVVDNGTVSGWDTGVSILKTMYVFKNCEVSGSSLLLSGAVNITSVTPEGYYFPYPANNTSSDVTVTQAIRISSKGTSGLKNTLTGTIVQAGQAYSHEEKNANDPKTDLVVPITHVSQYPTNGLHDDGFWYEL